MTASRVFWGTMIYACDRCGRRLTFYLEDGCEGPHGGGEEMFQLPADHPFEPGAWKPWPKTPSGRLIVPVPFVAGGCPTCQGKPPWHMREGAGCLMHVDWNRDGTLSLPLHGVPEHTARFHYPPDPRAPQACGIPIFPPYALRGEP